MLFCAMRTQWICSMNGAEGLNYSALYPLLDRKFKTHYEWEEAFADIRCMEVAALNAMRSK